MVGIQALFWLCISASAPDAVFAAEGLASPAPVVRYDDDVHRRLDAIEAQLRGLKRLPNTDGHASPSGDHAFCPTCNQDAHFCDCTGGKNDSEFPTVSVTGFFHLDAGYYDQDAANRATLGDIEDGLGFRRARLAATGNVAEYVSYILEFDFAQAQPRFVDVWMQFSDTPLGNVRIGRYRQPFGMAELTSIRDLPLLERPLPFALAPFRQTGIMLFDHAASRRATWAVSGYRHLSDNFGNVLADTGGYGAAARLTFLPLDFGEDRFVHLGADYSFNEPGRGLVQFVSTNEFFVGQNPNLGPDGLSVLPLVGVPPFVNTGEVASDHVSLFNVEGAAAFGRLVLQSEIRWADLKQTGGVTNTFRGAYAQLRYVLTGETLPYDRETGVFGRVRPRAPVDFFRGQWGAWEVVARWSYLDLNGTALPGPGRRLNNTTLGLNWIVNAYTKFQFILIHSDLSDPTQGDSTADTVAMRGQIDF